MGILLRSDALAVLQRHKAEFARIFGVEALGLFGSVARDEAGNESDVDVVVRMAEPDLFSLVHIKDALEVDFHRHVDVVAYPDHTNGLLRKRIDREAVYV
jgi:uncharacterized protein